MLTLFLTGLCLLQVDGYIYRDDFEAFQKNISHTLDSLLSKNYDKKLRPGLGGPPIQVGVNMYIKSLGPVAETEQMYTMDVYFRQTWYDERLKFDVPGIDEFSMSWLFLDKVWKPDTFFMNGKKSYLHKITSPNRFLRMRKDGFLMYSMRLTISASCKMHLRKFPLDSQKCPLIIGSYAYTATDLVYRWTDSGVGLEPGLEMAQYDLIHINVSSSLFATRAKEEYSVIQAIFHLKRSTGYFLLQIYVPCCLIVVTSWMSFWINPHDAPGRVSLAVTTVLSITTMGIGGRAQLPKVSYATAMDWFIILCLSFAFAVAVEYAVINFKDKFTAELRKVLEERLKLKKVAEDKVREEQKVPLISVEDVDVDASPIDEVEIALTVEENNWEENRRRLLLQPRRWCSVPNVMDAEAPRRQNWARTASEDDLTDSTERPRSVIESIGYSVKYTFTETFLFPCKVWSNFHFLPREEDIDLQKAPEKKFTKIDIWARKLFPLSFTFLLATYAIMYTFYIPDVVPGEEEENWLNI